MCSRQGDSNEYTQHTIFNIIKEKSLLIILSLPLWDISKRLKNEFETAVVDEPSVFEPLKLYCNNNYRISSVIKRSFFLPKQPQRSRSVL